jgi:hypothetical protein
MTYDPDLDRFFQELKAATSARAPSGKPTPAAAPIQILVLPEPDGDVVGRLGISGRVCGEFCAAANGEIKFRYRHDANRLWYVNKSITAFRKAAAIFNACCERVCELAADNNDTDPEATWALALLRSEFERIEPLGDPETSLWSATIHETDGGLLNLY